MEGLLNEGLAVTLIGMGTVFAVLILLWILLELMRIIFYKPKKQEESVISIPQEEQQTFSFIEERERIEEMDREELIAVLTAAVAASLNQSTYNLRVTSFRRVDNVSPVWNAISRKEQLESRL